MNFNDMKPFFIYGGLFHASGMITAFNHGQAEILGMMIGVTIVGVWFARAAYKKG